MVYADFTLAMLATQFGVSNKRRRLFDSLTPIEPSEQLTNALTFAQDLPIKSEKAKSEWIVAPVLAELRTRNHNYFTIYSGENLNVDDENGLKGECDFILAEDTGSFDISFPILQIVEAKRSDLELGVPQCAAQLVGARIFNENKGVISDKIYGCVTTGNEWLFLMLEKDLSIDIKIRYLNEVAEILAAFQYIIDAYRNRCV
jgi:hypothetical protein